MKRYAVFFALSLLAGLQVYGQVTSGAIIGLVQDPTSASASNAKVGVRNLDTNATSTANTAGDGRFQFPQLPVGSYQITVEAQGFAKYEQGPIVLRLNQEAE